MDPVRKLRAVALASPCSAEFRGLIAQLTRLGLPAEFEFAGSIDAALAGMGGVDLLLVSQDWPDQFSEDDVESLIDGFPLSRLVVVFGRWCDSDGRTRQVWPNACRVPIEAASPRILTELQTVLDNSPPVPRTADRGEVFGFDYGNAVRPRSERPSILINTPDLALASWFRDALRGRYEVVGPDAFDAHLLVWDIDPFDMYVVRSIAAKRESQPALPILAVAGFIRSDEQRALRKAGVDEVMSKLMPSSNWDTFFEAAVSLRLQKGGARASEAVP